MGGSRAMPIRIIITGGTFDKAYDPVKGELTFSNTHLPAILEQVRNRVDTRLQIVALVDSLHMAEECRLRILEACRTCEEKQIVITHGTDTLCKTAKLLGENLHGKTVVLMGAMVPYSVQGSDALYNLGAAMAAVQLLPPGVYVTMNSRIFPWNRVWKNTELGIFEGEDVVLPRDRSVRIPPLRLASMPSTSSPRERLFSTPLPNPMGKFIRKVGLILGMSALLLVAAFYLFPTLFRPFYAWRIRQAIARDRWDEVGKWIRRGQGEVAIPLLVEVFRSPDPNRQRLAEQYLERIGSRSIPALVDALHDADPRVRYMAAHALGLGRLRSTSTLPALIEAMRDQEAIVRESAIDTLGRLGEAASAAVSPLLHALTEPSESPSVKSAILLALGRIGTPKAEILPAFLRHLESENPQLRGCAAEAVGMLGKGAEEAISPLRHLLRDPHATVRFRAVEALGEIGSTSSSLLPDLLACLDDAELDIRIATIQTLGALGPSALEAIPKLELYLREEEPDWVRAYAKEAIQRIQGAERPHPKDNQQKDPIPASPVRTD